MPANSEEGQKYVNSMSLEFLVQELIPMSIRVSDHLQECNGNEETTTTKETRIDNQLSKIPNDFPGTINIFESSLLNSDDATIRVEKCGYNLGLRLAEVLMYKSSVTVNSRIVDILDIMKFVCRDVWRCLYGKQMDSLRTNHRGTFVLVVNDYSLILKMCSSKGPADTLRKAECYLWFPCGIIRGILASFGVEGNVFAEITQFPAVTFNIHTLINN